MAFPALTDHKESLQALAFAMRQEEGKDITYDELKQTMVDIGGGLDTKYSRWLRIDYSKMSRDFPLWVSMARNPKDNKQLDEWINSSVWTANAVIKSSYLDSQGYVFYQSGELPQFRGAFKAIAKRIKDNAVNTKVRQVYSLMARGTGDKWNPADVIALKSNEAQQIEQEMTAFENNTIRYAQRPKLKKIVQQNEELARRLPAEGKKRCHIVQDMNRIYWYNQYIDELYKSKKGVPISLKKVMVTNRKRLLEVTIPTVNITSFDHKETRGIEDALDLDLEIESVDWKENAAKCIVNFKLGGQTGHYMDIRSTASGVKADVQMQLQFGTAANHGKATLPVFSLITMMSKGAPAIRAQHNKKREIFGRHNIKIPHNKNHWFTEWNIFEDYATKRTGTFSRDTLGDDENPHSQLWAQYIHWLSNNRHEPASLLREYNNKLGNSARKNWAAGAKFIKNKVQSYEVGMVLDKERTNITATIKENIMKSVYTQAASKGFRIFGDDQITDYMTSSSYVKVGG